MKTRLLSVMPLRSTLLAVAGLLVGLAVSAQTAPTPGPGKIGDDQLMAYIGKDPLPPGAIPWQTLRQVKLVEGPAPSGKNAGKDAGKNPAEMRPEFSPAVKDLNNKEVKLYGFVMPLSTSVKQKHFLLSPLPSHCPYCVAQGPDSLVEVIAKIPVEFNQWEPIIVTGKLELVNDQYLFYRLNNAESVKF